MSEETKPARRQYRRTTERRQEILVAVVQLLSDPDSTGVTAPADDAWSVTTSNFALPTAAEVKRTGYNFLGWYLSADATEPVEANDITVNSFDDNGELTLYARWEPATYTLTFTYVDPNGDTIGDVPERVETYTTGDPARNFILGTQSEKVYIIKDEDEEKLDEVLYAKLQKAMRIQLLVRYALRLEERAEDELLQELREIAGVE